MEDVDKIINGLTLFARYGAQVEARHDTIAVIHKSAMTEGECRLAEELGWHWEEGEWRFYT